MSDPPATGAVAFIGLGMMGLPMASRLVAAGFAVCGADVSAAARAAFANAGGLAFETARQAVPGTSIVITMLPNGSIVRETLLGESGAVEALQPGALVIDMSSSAPMDTRRLADELAAKQI